MCVSLVEVRCGGVGWWWWGWWWGWGWGLGVGVGVGVGFDLCCCDRRLPYIPAPSPRPPSSPVVMLVCGCQRLFEVSPPIIPTRLSNPLHSRPTFSVVLRSEHLVKVQMSTRPGIPNTGKRSVSSQREGLLNIAFGGSGPPAVALFTSSPTSSPCLGGGGGNQGQCTGL